MDNLTIVSILFIYKLFADTVNKREENQSFSWHELCAFGKFNHALRLLNSEFLFRKNTRHLFLPHLLPRYYVNEEWVLIIGMNHITRN